MKTFASVVATMEDQENALALAEVETPEEAAETSVDVAETAADVSEDVAEIVETDDAIDQAFEAGDNIQELQAKVEGSLDSEAEAEAASPEVLGEEGEGLSETEATVIEITHESIMSSIGMGAGATKRYTSESFGGKATRRQVTMEALDNLKASGKKIYEGIIAALKAAWNSVSNFLVGLLKNRSVMEKHLVNLEAKASAIPATLERRAETFKTSAGALSVAGMANVATARQVLKSAMGAVTASAAIGDALGRMQGESTDEDAKAAILNAVKLIGDPSKTAEGEAYGHLVGGKSVKVDENGSISFVEGEKKVDVIEAPKREEMISLAREARAVVSKLKDIEKNQSKFKALVDALSSQLARVATAVQTKVGSDESKAAAGIKKKAQLAKSLMTKAGGQLPGAAFSAVKAVADYINAGINNYKPQAAAAA